MKRFNKEKVLEKLQELNSSFKLDKSGPTDKIVDSEERCVLFLNAKNVRCIQKGIPHTGEWNPCYALMIEYLRKYKDEIIIEEYTKEEVVEVLVKKGFYLNGNLIYAENGMWIASVLNVASCLNDKVEERILGKYDKEELILATIVKNELEKGE